MKPGEMVLYDRFGTAYDILSPSNAPEDFGIGIVVQVLQDPPGREDDSCAVVIKDDGSQGTFSLSYLIRLDSFEKKETQ